MMFDSVETGTKILQFATVIVGTITGVALTAVIAFRKYRSQIRTDARENSVQEDFLNEHKRYLLSVAESEKLKLEVKGLREDNAQLQALVVKCNALAQSTIALTQMLTKLIEPLAKDKPEFETAIHLSEMLSQQAVELNSSITDYRNTDSKDESQE